MPAGMGYGPIGQRMEQMQAMPVHGRDELMDIYGGQIPPDVQQSFGAMQGMKDPLGRSEMHTRMHKQMRSHARAGKFGARRSLSELNKRKRAMDQEVISGTDVDNDIEQLQLLEQEVQDMKRRLGVR